MKLWIGMDDTDSPNGMCTTYLAVLAMEELQKAGVEVIGFPRLIRLNPTIPYKTRGNGAVSFLVDTPELEIVMEIVDSTIQEFSELDHEDTNPGVVFVRNDDDILNTLSRFALRAVRDLVSMDEALFMIGRFMIPHLTYKKGRGLIGALASVGFEGEDFTYELLAYRKPERFGEEREINEESFFRADELYYPKTWDTVDWHNKAVVSVPNGPDPVLYGIRGSDFYSINKASEILKTEEVDRRMMFITNHSTDMHLIPEKEARELRNFHSYILSGLVVENPTVIRGGHVFFNITTKFGMLKCAAFEPTKQFRDVITKLVKGDHIRVFGSLKKDTLNLEKLEIISLVREKEYNPRCPVCGKRMESAGKNQPFRCRTCKTIAKEKVVEKIEREIEEGFYEVPPVARRHLSKPLVRMNVPKKHIFR
jgi:tRNA(Ile2)-agmatinylcytidine synthase